MSGAAPLSANERFAKLFPDPNAARVATAWSVGRRRSVAVAAVAIAIVLIVGILAMQAFGSSGPHYRLATVSDQNVDAVLSGVGTIEPVAQATVAFPVAGTVGSVAVKMGDAVSVGQPLASLDPGALNQTLDQKQAALAQAQLTLSKALSGQSVGGASSSGSSGQATAVVQSAGSSGGPRIVLTAASGSSDPAIAAAQQSVLAAQQKVDTALAAASSALSSAQSVCAGVETPPSPTTTTTAPPTTTTIPPDDLTACQTALAAVSVAQTAVANAQHALASASNALDDLLDQRAASSSAAAGAGGSGQGTGSGSASTSQGSGSTGSRSSSSSSPTAADLAAYQQAVDAAASQVAVAQQAVAQATIASPIAGTVVAVNLAVGTTVTSASTTADIIVQGAGGYEVSTTVGVEQIPHVAIGDAVSVAPDGSHKTLTGKVTSISVAPNTSSSTTSYLVVIGLIKPDAALNNGSTGTTHIITESAKSALAVPTSSLSTSGTRHTVEAFDGGSVKQVAVQVGVVGNTWTEIKSGLTKGEQVVLADASQPLPGSATNATNATNGTTTIGGRVITLGGLNGGAGAGTFGGGLRGTGQGR